MQFWQTKLKTYLYTLQMEERSSATIKAYARHIGQFLQFTGTGPLKKPVLLSYKQHLLEKGYQPATVNTMLVPVNGFLTFVGKGECRVKLLKIQQQAFRDNQRELTLKQYRKMVHTCAQNRQTRTQLLLQTLCATGIRVSELRFVTVQALQQGFMVIYNKGKCRQIPFSHKLKEKLLAYCKKCGIQQGCVFITRTGRPMHRTQVWRTIKAAGAQAGIQPKRVFPHNLRHLFSYTFYMHSHQDLVGLAGLLGHSSIETTRIYTQLQHSAVLQQIDTLGLVV